MWSRHLLLLAYFLHSGSTQEWPLPSHHSETRCVQGRKCQNHDNYQRWSRTVTIAETIQGKKWKATDLHSAEKILSPPPIGLGISFWPIHNYRCTGPATNAGAQQGHTQLSSITASSRLVGLGASGQTRNKCMYHLNSKTQNTNITGCSTANITLHQWKE